MDIFELFLYKYSNFLLIDQPFNAISIEPIQLACSLQLIFLSSHKIGQTPKSFSGFHAHFALGDGPISLSHSIPRQTLSNRFKQFSENCLCWLNLTHCVCIYFVSNIIYSEVYEHFNHFEGPNCKISYLLRMMRQAGGWQSKRLRN